MKKIIKYIIFTLIFFIVYINQILADEKIKVGLIVPLSGEYKEIGNSILKATRLAINKIDDSRFKIIPKDTRADPEETFKVSKELQNQGIKIIIGPVFNKNLIYLKDLKETTFLSLSNTNTNNQDNVINGGINAISQLKAIKTFQEFKNLERSILLIPDSDFRGEIEDAVVKTKIKLKDKFIYDTDPTILTSQIEQATRYKIRKQNLKDEIKRLENSNEVNKENKILNLKKKDTLGGINFDSVIIADFDESLKSVTTSLLYTDVSSDRVSYITLNQWFDKSILKEKNLQPIYFPSINKENYDDFVSEYFKIYDEYPNQISFLSFDLVGLVYFLIYKNNFNIDKKIFYKKNKFKGKIGIFEINKNKISHILNFYVADDNKFKKIF